MEIREFFNRHAGITTGVTIALIVIVLFFIFFQVKGMTSNGPGKVYYTDDDGATWFSDVDRQTPFEHNGKQAVRAHVYKCKDGKKFVGWLERESAAGREALAKRQAGQNVIVPDDIREAKKPGTGDKDWVPGGLAEKFSTVTTVTCPDGSIDWLVVTP